MKMERFEIGDTVTWESQAFGHKTRKTGIIVRVLRFNGDHFYNSPAMIAAREFAEYERMFEGANFLQGCDTVYFILVGKRLYMPRPKWLSLEKAKE